MKRISARLLLLLLCLVAILPSFAGCGKKDEPEITPNVELPDLSLLDMSEYVTLPEDYRLVKGARSGEDVYDYAVKNCTVLKYPEGLAEYFEQSLAATNAYYADLAGMTVGEYLASLGQTEEEQHVFAEENAKAELVFRALLTAENVSVSEEEFSAHYEKFASYYKTAYGYSETYIEERLSDEIRESMLYEKLMEKLATYVEKTEE